MRISYSARVRMSGSGTSIASYLLYVRKLELVSKMIGWVNVRPPERTLMFPFFRSVHNNALEPETASKISVPWAWRVRVITAVKDVLPVAIPYSMPLEPFFSQFFVHRLAERLRDRRPSRGGGNPLGRFRRGDTLLGVALRRLGLSGFFNPGGQLVVHHDSLSVFQGKSLRAIRREDKASNRRFLLRPWQDVGILSPKLRQGHLRQLLPPKAHHLRQRLHPFLGFAVGDGFCHRFDLLPELGGRWVGMVHQGLQGVGLRRRGDGLRRPRCQLHQLPVLLSKTLHLPLPLHPPRMSVKRGFFPHRFRRGCWRSSRLRRLRGWDFRDDGRGRLLGW